VNPPAGVPLVALALPLMITAGAVHEAEIERCALAPLLTRAG